MERFKVIEENFWHYANVSQYENLDIDEEIAELAGEMFICVTAIFILIDKVANAINFGVKALACCQLLENDLHSAILELTLANAKMKDFEINEGKNYALSA